MSDRRNRNENLEKLLTRWNVDVSPDSGMAEQVMRRIRTEPAPRPLFLRLFLSNPTAGIAFACMALFAALAAVQTWRLHEQHLTESRQNAYFTLIDPVDKLHTPGSDGLAAMGDDISVVDMLAWMQDSFDLSRAQFSALCELHGHYAERLTGIYAELRSIETRYQKFEALRRDDKMIDFMALYDLLQEREAARNDSSATSRQLVRRVLNILTPEQRLEYLSMLGKPAADFQDSPKTSGTNAGA